MQFLTSYKLTRAFFFSSLQTVQPILPTRVTGPPNGRPTQLNSSISIKVYPPNPHKTFPYSSSAGEQSLVSSFLLHEIIHVELLRAKPFIRMEDPGEWEIEEYYTSSEEEECKSKVSWILNRGLQLGKKIVITGVVISSAPLVLPPLVVVSALGFAVSVPFGVIFASYACTEKLMNKLLPMPASSPMLEYETGMDDVEQEAESEFGGEFLQEKELDKQIADKKEVIEMRIKLVEDGKKRQHEGHVLGDNGLRDIEEVEQENLYKDESLKEKAYEEDVGEYLEGEEEESLEGRKIEIEGVEKEVDKEPLIGESKKEKISPEVKRVMIVTAGEGKNARDVTKTDELVIVARGVQRDIRGVEKVTSNEEQNELKEGATGLLGKIRDDGDIDESAKKNKKKNKHRGKKSHAVGENKEDKNAKNAKEMDKKLNKQLGRKGDETTSEAKKGKTKATAEGLMREDVAADNTGVLTSGKIMGYQKTLNNGNHTAKKSKTTDVELKPLAVEQGCRVDCIVSDEKEVNSIVSNAARSETAVSINPEKKVNQENLDFLENQVVQVFPQSKHDGVSEDTPISKNEVSLSEEKIWEQINAMRMIVGYKAAPQSSCMEELKALYVFTGIEPPSSFDKPFDLKEAEDKLYFLMSIVGVK